jgi:glutamate synthase (NADPH) large chain
MTLVLEGDANDYVGKGLSGGLIVVRPPAAATYDWSANVVVGNTVLYGATSGRAFFAGRAGERFAVRNSGAAAVVEGTGDHGCEYMTGGVVIVLGSVGRNFAAGMSGGVAYVYDEDETFAARCNMALVAVEALETREDEATVKTLIEEHAERTTSSRARAILNDWPSAAARFKKVISVEYRRALVEQAPLSAASGDGRAHLVLVKG